jgi:hypothetical protein
VRSFRILTSVLYGDSGQLIPWAFHSLRKSPRYPLHRGLGGLQSRSVSSREEKSVWAHQDSNAKSLMFQPVSWLPYTFVAI